MPTFIGHLLPGTIFLLFGLYYAKLVSLALLRGQKLLFLPFPPRSQGSWLQRLPAEGALKVIGCTTGILGEFFYPPGANRLALLNWDDPARPFLYHNSWQHVTMYGFFLASGLVDLVSQTWLARRRLRLEQAVLTLAFHVLLLLLLSHSQGKNVLETRVHTLLLLPVFLLALVLTIEQWAPDQPQLWVAKTWMLLVLGSWMLQIGVVMYYPPTGRPWHGENPADLMFLTTFFCWHLALDAALLAAVYGLSILWHRRYATWTAGRGDGYQVCPVGASSEELQKLKGETCQPDGGV
ncbi:transmembrane epididymal protein 1A-like [Ornithorhynchus anatinus]|uniref:transmembrane epididymal protein 1A-like n=1 Tax=Ornithorhynchus anatinus TaxID=9258 RepID=UPI0010A89A15|nr:transmembrane epididymal protein 1A-like [Ornithorhynchus anatinus]